jgi:transcriptional regulator with XRE-family HTH domain
MQISATTDRREFRRFLLVAQLEAKEIGERIARARNEAGLTQDELVEMATFSKRSLSDYERGATIPYRQMREISKLLDRPVEWFLHGDDEEEMSVVERLDSIDDRLAAIEGLLSLLVPAEQAEALGVARSEAASARRELADLSEPEVPARRASGND